MTLLGKGRIISLLAAKSLLRRHQRLQPPPHSEGVDYLTLLPTEIWTGILGFLDYKSLKRLQLACKYFYNLINHGITGTAAEIRFFRDHPVDPDRWRKALQMASPPFFPFEDLHPILASAMLHSSGFSFSTLDGFRAEVVDSSFSLFYSLTRLARLFRQFVRTNKYSKIWEENATSPSTRKFDLENRLDGLGGSRNQFGEWIMRSKRWAMIITSDGRGVSVFDVLLARVVGLYSVYRKRTRDWIRAAGRGYNNEGVMEALRWIVQRRRAEIGAVSKEQWAQIRYYIVKTEIVERLSAGHESFNLRQSLSLS